MKLKNILKTTGALHIILGALIIFLLIFSVEKAFKLLSDIYYLKSC